MNRRGFLKFLGMATAGAVVAVSAPSAMIPKVASPMATKAVLPTGPWQPVGMKGIPYFLDNTGSYFGAEAYQKWQHQAERAAEQSSLGFTDEEWTALQASYRPLIPEDYRRVKAV